jgi:hypothetical protein
VSKAIEARTIPYSTTKKLGVQKLGGFVAEGTRGSYTVSAGQNHNNSWRFHFTVVGPTPGLVIGS